MNLAQIALNSLGNLGKNEEVELFSSKGQVNNAGSVTTHYNTPILLKCLVQSEVEGELDHKNSKCVASYISRFYYTKTSLSSLDSARGTSGDIFRRNDGTYWLITEIIDDFSTDYELSSWQCARAVLQNKDFEILITD